MTRAAPGDGDGDGEVPLYFEGDYSFINMNGRDISQEQRETISWHVLHKYEPFKRQRRAEINNNDAANRDDRKAGQVRTDPLKSQQLTSSR